MELGTFREPALRVWPHKQLAPEVPHSSVHDAHLNVKGPEVQTAGVGPPTPLAPKNGRAAFLKKLDSDRTVMPRLLLGDGVSLFSTAFFRTSLRVTGPCLVLQIPGGRSRLSELSGYCISEALTTCGARARGLPRSRFGAQV